VQGPKHVASLNKDNNIRSLCFDLKEPLFSCKYNTARMMHLKIMMYEGYSCFVGSVTDCFNISEVFLTFYTTPNIIATTSLRYLQVRPSPFCSVINTIQYILIYMYIYNCGTVRDRIPVGTKFSVRPDRPWSPPSLL